MSGRPVSMGTELNLELWVLPLEGGERCQPVDVGDDTCWKGRSSACRCGFG
jgi:hypothetical protein